MIAEGVGVCPQRDGGHVWAPWFEDPRKSCVHCGRPGRDNVFTGESGGYLHEAGHARMRLFDGLVSPASSHGQVKR